MDENYRNVPLILDIKVGWEIVAHLSFQTTVRKKRKDAGTRESKGQTYLGTYWSEKPTVCNEYQSSNYLKRLKRAVMTHFLNFSQIWGSLSTL